MIGSGVGSQCIGDDRERIEAAVLLGLHGFGPRGVAALRAALDVPYAFPEIWSIGKGMPDDTFRDKAYFAQALAMHVPNVDAKNIRDVYNGVDRKSHLMTDDSLLYYHLGPTFAKPDAVNHSAEEYVRGEAYTNTAESFFAVLKRGVYGNFHAVSKKHLQRYVNEAAFKCNNRNKLGIEDAERAQNAVRGAAGKRLMYRLPDSKVRAG